MNNGKWSKTAEKWQGSKLEIPPDSDLPRPPQPIKIIITGRPYSKKNSRQSRQARTRTGKLYSYMAPGENYASFRQDALYQLLTVKERFSGAVQIDYIFYRKGKELQDVDNAICSINDVLQDAKIIADDKFVLKGTFEVVPGAKNWSTELQIKELMI
jgi:Holliday junction resolvase RusA-like endonuclease